MGYAVLVHLAFYRPGHALGRGRHPLVRRQVGADGRARARGPLRRRAREDVERRPRPRHRPARAAPRRRRAASSYDVALTEACSRLRARAGRPPREAAAPDSGDVPRAGNGGAAAAPSDDVRGRDGRPSGFYARVAALSKLLRARPGNAARRGRRLGLRPHRACSASSSGPCARSPSSLITSGPRSRARSAGGGALAGCVPGSRVSMAESQRVEVLVIGSGAGGAMTALELARAGATSASSRRARDAADRVRRGLVAEAMQRLYRRGGMTPILGRVAHRLRRGRVRRREHRDQQRLLAPHAARGAPALQGAVRPARTRRRTSSRRTSSRPRSCSGVSTYPGSRWPKSTEVFARGIDAMGWAAQEVPRAAPGLPEHERVRDRLPDGGRSRE